MVTKLVRAYKDFRVGSGRGMGGCKSNTGTNILPLKSALTLEVIDVDIPTLPTQSGVSRIVVLSPSLLIFIRFSRFVMNF